MLKLFKNLKAKDFGAIFLCIVLICGQVWLDLTMPDFMSNITQLVMTGGSQGQIWLEGLKMLGCALGSAAMAVIVGFFASRISSVFGMTIREKVFSKVQNFSMQNIKNFSTPSLITRTTNDVSQVQMTLAMGMQVMIKAPILAVWAIVKILGKSWQWSLATAGAVFILFLLVLVIMIFAIPKFKKVQTQTDNLNKVARENLLGTRVVRAYNAEKYEESRFENVNNTLTTTHLKVSRVMALLGPTMSLVMGGLGLAIYWIGAFVINNAGMQDKIIIFSDMMVFSQYAIQVVMAFIMLCMIFIILPRATVSARRINEVLNSEINIKSGSVKNETENSQTIEFKDVSFKYPDADEYVLKNVSFKAKAGETVAFIGSTGSGKSTLINLVPRFYDCTEGEIKINGINVKDYNIETLNNKIGYVPQKAVIFSGTIKSNIVIGDSIKQTITDEDILKALRIAECENFVKNMDGGVDAKIEQGGTNLSGGQKQRLAIARAIAKNPEIYIFDDSFSALDYKTDLNLRKALKQECGNATKLIVAQRIGTIKDADKIVVLNDGEVVGQGTHEELLNSCEVYKEIALSQLDKEEL